MDKLNKERGFIGTLILIIVALALLKYFFNFSIFDAASSEQGRATISYIRDVLDAVWSYIGAPLVYVWREIIAPLFLFVFDSLKQLLEEGRQAMAQ